MSFCSGWVVRRCLGALLLSGCLNGHASDAGSVAGGADDGRAPDSAASAATVKNPAPWVLVNVNDERVTVDGKPVTRDAKAVHDALAQRKNQKVGLEIDLESEHDRSLAETVLSETGWREGVLRAGALELQLEGRSVAADTGAHPVIVFATFLAGATELWRLDTRDESSGSLLTIKADDPQGVSTARAQLEQLCHGDLCSAFVVLAPAMPVVATLKEWKRLGGNVPVQLNFDQEVKAPPAKGGLPTTVTGRLAPELIQTIVRHHFQRIRPCYEQALGKDPHLAGRISVKFVIDREGNVTSTENAGSTLPDINLNTCIIDVFKHMSFPPPQDGIVTVIYPIALAPG
jgi:hypothetical protein